MGTSFGRRLRALMALRGLTITEFAQRVGVNPTHLCNVCAGRMKLTTWLRDKLREEVGERAWAFVLGELHTIDARAEEPSGVAA